MQSASASTIGVRVRSLFRSRPTGSSVPSVSMGTATSALADLSGHADPELLSPELEAALRAHVPRR